MNSGSPLKRTKAQKTMLARKQAKWQARPRDRFWMRVVKRRHYWLARRKMRGHPHMTLRHGMALALIQQLQRA
jgi:hypothetical protein